MNSWRDDLYPGMLIHDGQKGMKWGRRRYRNYDGTLTPAGRERYGVGTTAQNAVKKLSRKERKAQKEIKRKASAKAAEKAAKQATEESKRAAEEARQAQEELKKAQEAAAAEAEKKAKEAKAGHATAEENMQARLDNDRLREQINALKLEREYESLVRPKNQTPQKKTMMEKALAFVDTAKKVTTAANDVYKMIGDIKKGFKGESDYDRLKKQSDMDKLKYDMETREQKRKEWADGWATKAAAKEKAAQDAKQKEWDDLAERVAAAANRTRSYWEKQKQSKSEPAASAKAEQFVSEVRDTPIFSLGKSAKYNDAQSYVDSVRDQKANFRYDRMSAEERNDVLQIMARNLKKG